MCRDTVGTDEITLEIAQPATVDDFWKEIVREYPSLEKYKNHSRIAVNMEYAPKQRPLQDGDEVCIIPPVSGG